MQRQLPIALSAFCLLLNKVETVFLEKSSVDVGIDFKVNYGNPENGADGGGSLVTTGSGGSDGTSSEANGGSGGSEGTSGGVSGGTGGAIGEGDGAMGDTNSTNGSSAASGGESSGSSGSNTGGATDGGQNTTNTVITNKVFSWDESTMRC